MNEKIDTPTFRNTIDRLAPTSSVQPLPAIGVPTTRPELTIALIGGFIQITVRGDTGKSYELQVASNLATPNPWTTTTKITLTAPTQTWRETQPANQPQRFYRAVQSP